MKHLVVGVDTSCYTTSIACVTKEGIVFEQRTVLSVPLGSRGLRQSDAVFQHVRNLPKLVSALFEQIDGRDVARVAVSARPTDGPESYMPVFLAGKSVATAIAAALDAPLFETTHQAGHVRAALLCNETLLGQAGFLALHLSGGTTDILRVTPHNGRVGTIEALGGSDDLHAGQFVDRVGVRLGLPFPSGPSLEKLAMTAQRRDIRLSASVRGLHCSFSGPETQALRLWDDGVLNAEIAYAVYDCLARTISKLIENAVAEYKNLPVLLSGGVAGSALLRTLLEQRTDQPLYYAQPGLSADNAVGAALLGLDEGIPND